MLTPKSHNPIFAKLILVVDPKHHRVRQSVLVDHQGNVNRFIFDNMVEQGFDSTWIGLTDRQTEGDFEWADGAQLDYENWDRGEPNNNSGDGGEDCASILTDRGRASFWDDRPCNRAYSFVCERALP